MSRDKNTALYSTMSALELTKLLDQEPCCVISRLENDDISTLRHLLSQQNYAAVKSDIEKIFNFLSHYSSVQLAQFALTIVEFITMRFKQEDADEITHSIETLCHRIIKEVLPRITIPSRIQFYLKAGDVFFNNASCSLALPYYTQAHNELKQLNHTDPTLANFYIIAEKLLEKKRTFLELKTQHHLKTSLIIKAFKAIKNDMTISTWFEKDVKSYKDRTQEQVQLALQEIDKIHADLTELPDNDKTLSNLLICLLNYWRENLIEVFDNTQDYTLLKKNFFIAIEPLKETAHKLIKHHQWQLAKACYALIIEYGNKLPDFDSLEFRNMLNQLSESQKNLRPAMTKSPVNYQALWQTWQEKLVEARETFKKTEFSSNGQQEFSASIINIWKNLAKTTTQVLGEPPCGFTLLGTGSFSHQSCGLFSDIEGALLIANEKYRNHPYFFDWITLLQFHVNSLGDAWRLIGNEKISTGLCFDGKNFKYITNEQKELLQTPEALAEWVSNGELQGNLGLAYSLLHPVEIFSLNKKGEHGLFARYQSKLTVKKPIIEEYYKIHTKEWQETQKSKNLDIVDIKERYLARLLYWCMDVALYQGYQDQDQLILTNVPQIIMLWEKQNIFSAPFINLINTAYTQLQTLRNNKQLKRGGRPDEVVFEKTNAGPFLPELTPNEAKSLEIINAIINMAYNGLTQLAHLVTNPYDPIKTVISKWKSSQNTISTMEEKKNNYLVFIEDPFLKSLSLVLTQCDDLDIYKQYYELIPNVYRHTFIKYLEEQNISITIIEALSHSSDQKGIRISAKRQRVEWENVLLEKITDPIPSCDFLIVSKLPAPHNCHSLPGRSTRCYVIHNDTFLFVDKENYYYTDVKNVTPDKIRLIKNLLNLDDISAENDIQLIEELPIDTITHIISITGQAHYNDTDSKQRVLVQWANVDKKPMTRFLKPHIQKEIFNPDGTLNEKDCQKDGQRWVKALHAEQNDQLDETIAYVKFPELPGMQMAAETIADRISNQGARSTLLRCLHPQKKLAYPLLFSQPAGKTLLNIQRESSNLNTFEATLSPYNYTLKIFESIFIRSGDGKASNIAAIKRHSNETSLIHFDAEQCFNSELIKNDLLGEKLNLKDLVFCFKPFKEGKLNREAVIDTMNLHPKTLIEDWLEELDAFNKCWLGNPKTSTPGIFTQEEVVHWANQTNYQFCFIPAAFSYGTITISYQLFLELRALFFDTNQSPEKLVAPETWPSNHQALVGEIYPAIIPHYEKARLSANTPEGRFNALPTDYEKVIDPDCSVPVSKSKKTGNKDYIEQSLTGMDPKKRKDLRTALKQGEFWGPKQAIQNELLPVEAYYQKIDRFCEQLERGETQEFQDIQHANYLKQRIINKLAWQDLPEEVQQKIITILPSISFKKLFLSNNTALSPLALEQILNSSRNLTHLKLSGPLLTEKSLQQVAYLPVLKWLEISHININKLKINPWLMPFSKDTFTQLNQLTIENCNSLETLEINASQLKIIRITKCNRLVNIKLKALSIAEVDITPSSSINYSLLTKSPLNRDNFLHADQHFIMALNQGNTETLEWFLNVFKIDLNFRYPDGNTLLHIAFKNRAPLNILEFLIVKGAKCFYNNELKTPFDIGMELDESYISLLASHQICMAEVEIKIALIGFYGTGKNHLIANFTGNSYIERNNKPLQAIDFYKKAIPINGIKYKLFISNVTLAVHNLGYDMYSEKYYQGTEVFIIFYSITDRKTFERVELYASSARTIRKNSPIFLVGNKSDLNDQRTVSYEEGLEMAKKIQAIEFFECSAVKNININEVFLAACKSVKKDITFNPMNFKENINTNPTLRESFFS